MREMIEELVISKNGNLSKTEAQLIAPPLLIKDAVFVRNKGSLIKVKFDEILWIKGDGNYTTLVTKKQVYSLRNILKEFENLLPTDDFLRIHKSYMVRIDEITAINSKEVMIAEYSVPVGRTFYQKLLNGIIKMGNGNGD